MRKLCYILVVGVFFLVFPKSADAYGGGGGFPPGYYGHHNPEVHCSWETRDVGKRVIRVPVCRIEKDHSSGHHKGSSRDDYKHRLSAFGKRLRDGHR